MLFKTRLLVLSLALAWTLPALAGPGCGMADKGGCIWGDQKASFSLADKDDTLLLAAVVEGCAGKRAGFQKRLAAEIDGAKKGTSCKECPFGIEGLSFAAEKTELGSTVVISGPKEKRDAFKAAYEAKLAAIKAAPAGSGCGGGCGGCDAAKAAPKAGGCGGGTDDASKLLEGKPAGGCGGCGGH
jgi:hypothetical protein